jgi:hypothetical protein
MNRYETRKNTLYHFRLVFVRCSVWILAGTQAFLAVVFCKFPLIQRVWFESSPQATPAKYQTPSSLNLRIKNPFGPCPIPGFQEIQRIWSAKLMFSANLEVFGNMVSLVSHNCLVLCSYVDSVYWEYNRHLTLWFITI